MLVCEQFPVVVKMAAKIILHAVLPEMSTRGRYVLCLKKNTLL